MNISMTILAQTKTGTAIEIIVLLLIAGLIAYLTSYLYYKSVYSKKIAALEAEKNDLNSKINRLNNEISNLEKELEEKEKEEGKGKK